MEKITDSIFKFLRLDTLVNNLSGYLEARMELLKIEIREDVANLLAKGLIYGAMGLFAFLFLIFFSVGLAHYLNQFFAASYGGYFAVAGLYGLALLVFLVFRHTIGLQIERHFNTLIKQKKKKPDNG
ncbi:MAG: phage holin family protein [Cyclobacteriaceae bacterium]|jgi:uncharacterized membrane protein YqjE|nr:phage holin family protein [Cyclobacteriaceae bacterium]